MPLLWICPLITMIGAADVQIGLKNANSEPVYLTMNRYVVDENNEYNVIRSTAQISTSSATDRYYSIGNHVLKNDRTVLSFTNTGEGILSITNIKITFAEKATTTAPAIASGKNSTNAVLMTLRADAEEEAKTEPEVKLDAALDVNIRKTSVKVGSTVVVKATTSADVESLVVNGSEITKYSQNKQTGKRSWTATVKAEEAGDLDIEVIAYSADGDALETVTKTVEVAEKKASVAQKAIESIISKLFR